MFTTVGAETCERCGGPIYNEDIHRQICADRSPFAGECPMCGEQYESYTEHLNQCEGSG